MSERANELRSFINIQLLLLDFYMQIHTLLSRLDEIENSQRKSIFESIGNGDVYFSTWEKEIHPILCEVALTTAQIDQLFKGVEKTAGRSALGKGLDAVKGASDKISDAWFNKFGGMLQSSGPVRAFDQKWDELKSSIGAKHPELAERLAKYGQFAKDHPNLHKFLLAIGGSVAAAVGVAAAGGIGAGALAVGTGTGVAVGILNIADRLLQGQKLSTAVGRGATTGAIAGLAAGAAAKIGDMVKAGIKSDAIADLKGVGHVTKHTMDYNGTPFSAVTKEPLTSQLKNAFDVLDPKNAQSVNNFAKLMAQASSPEYQKSLEMVGVARDIIAATARQNLNVVTDLMKIGTAAAGGAASAATNQQPVSESLSRQQITELFGITGNKVDASKLKKAWEKAGSPTDSDAVATVLQGAGVSAETVTQVFTDLQIPPPQSQTPPDEAPPPTNPTASGINIDDLVAQINKLAPAKKQQIIAALQG